MSRNSPEEIGMLAALAGMAFVCLTTWGVVIWAVVEAARMFTRMA